MDNGSGATLYYSAHAEGVISSEVTQGTAIPMLQDFKDKLYVTTSPGVTVTLIKYAPSGMFQVYMSPGAQNGDTVTVNANQFADQNGGVLSGTLVITFNGGDWIPSLQ
ncbi:hypothetical protein [Brevibacillus fluminis]|nr:hypothetical protein [Brevibacillus fluminis]